MNSIVNRAVAAWLAGEGGKGVIDASIEDARERLGVVLEKLAEM